MPHSEYLIQRRDWLIHTAAVGCSLAGAGRCPDTGMAHQALAAGRAVRAGRQL